MTDNVQITAGSGTLVSTEEITTLNGSAVSAQHVQRTANAIRTADGAAYDVASGAGAVTPGVQRQTLASDDPAVVALQAMQSATGPVLAPSAATLVKGAITSAMTGTTSTSLLAAPSSGLFNYVTTIIVSNAHASVGTNVLLQDGNGGNTMMTIPAAPNYGGSSINLPVPLKQTTAATALYVANETTGASTKVTVVGYTGV